MTGNHSGHFYRSRCSTYSISGGGYQHGTDSCNGYSCRWTINGSHGYTRCGFNYTTSSALSGSKAMQDKTGHLGFGHGHGERCLRATGGHLPTYNRSGIPNSDGSANPSAHESIATHGRCGHHGAHGAYNESQTAHMSSTSSEHGGSHFGTNGFDGLRTSINCLVHSER